MIVAVYESQARSKPLSSAELAIPSAWERGRLELKLVQHRGRRNVAPSPVQAMAVTAFMEEFATNAGWQAWARRGLREMAMRQLVAVRKHTVEPAMLVAGERALERTLGPTRVAQLLGEPKVTPKH